MSSPNDNRKLSLEVAREVLKKMVEALVAAEDDASIVEARRAANNDMLSCMQLVFPIQTRIQIQVAARYGFSNDGPGLIRFLQVVKSYEKHDDQIQKLTEELRVITIPQIPTPLSLQS